MANRELVRVHIATDPDRRVTRATGPRVYVNGVLVPRLHAVHYHHTVGTMPLVTLEMLPDGVVIDAEAEVEEGGEAGVL